MNIKEVLFKKYSFKEIFLSFFSVFLPNFLEILGTLGFIAFILSMLLYVYAAYYMKFKCYDAACGAPWGWIFAFAFIWFLIPFFLFSLLFAFIAALSSKSYTPSNKWQISLKIIGLLFYLFIMCFLTLSLIL